MTINVGKLMISLEANVARLQSDMNQAKGVVSGAMKGIQREVDTVKKLFGGLAAAAGMASFASMIKGSIDAADHLNDLSKQTGITVEALGGLGYAGQLNGVGLEEVAKGAVKLSKNMAEAAAGTGDAQGAFAAMGISVKDATGKLKSSDQVLKEVADKFAMYEDGPEKAALALKIFGKEGAALIPMLNEGAAGIGKAQEEFAKYSGVTKATTEQADAFNDKLAKLKLMSSGTATTIAAELLPSMSNITDALLDFKQNSNSAEVAAGLLGFGLKSLVSIGLGVAHVFSEIGKDLGALAAAAVAVATGEFDQASKIMEMRGQDQVASNENFARQIEKVWADSGKAQAKTAEDTAQKVNAPMSANTEAAKALETAYKSAMNALGGDNAKLEAEIKWMSEYGVSVAFANRALMEFETTRGKFKGLGQTQKDALVAAAARKDLLEGAKKDEKEYQDFQKKLNEDAEKQDNEYQQQRRDTVFAATRDLHDESRRLAAESILDEKARAYALLDIEKEKWLNIISLSEEGSAERQEIETAYQEWLARKSANIQMDEWKKVFSSMESIGKQAFVAIFSRDGKSAAESLGKAIQASVIDLLYELTMKRWIIQIEAAITGGSSGGSSGGGAFDGVISKMGSWLSELWHTGGGPGDAPQSYRAVPSAVFETAPRFHSGIGPGERPAVIRNDESVLTPGQMKQLAPVDQGKSGDTYNQFTVDMRGASVEAVSRLENLVMSINGSIERRAVSAVSQARMRGAS